jgi:ABC-type glycerol-3-phosphate transport system substrate-binding protein
MKHKIALLLAVLMVVSMVGGNVQRSSAQDGGKEILVWMTGGEVDAQIFQAAADLWSEQTGNTVVVEPIDWSSAHARMLTAAASGEGPDIITGGLSWGIEFGELGGMVDLNAGYPDDIAAMQESENAGMWSSIVSTDGAVYGVPYDLTSYLFIYRPDILAEYGFEQAPQTWDELLALQQAFNEANGEGGFAINWGNTDWLGYSNFLWQAGGDWYDADCNPIIDSVEAEDALNFYASMYDAGATTDTGVSLDAGIDSGMYPFGYTGSWIIGGMDANYPNSVGKWAVTSMAAGPTGTRTAFIGGRVIGVMSYSSNVDESFDLIKFIRTEEGAQALIDAAVAQNNLFIPPQNDFIQYTAFGDVVRDALIAQLDDAKGPPNCPGWEAATSDVTLQIQSVIFEGTDAADAVAEMAAIMEDKAAQ